MGAPEQLQRHLDALASAKDVLSRLDAARRLRELAEAAEAELVLAARAEGLSWTTIGARYGMTKQGAQQRFGPAKKRRRRARDKGADSGGDEGRRAGERPGPG